MLLFTPETSGGLLVAIPPERLETLTGLFADERQPGWVVGEVVEGEGIEIISRPTCEGPDQVAHRQIGGTGQTAPLRPCG